MSTQRFTEKLLNRKNTIIIIFGFVISFFLLENPWFGNMALEKNYGVGMIETSFYNSPKYIFEYFENLGAIGRNSYIIVSILDIIFIVFLFFVLCRINVSASSFANKQVSVKGIILLPLLRSIADLLENSSLIINCSLHPNSPMLMLSTIFIMIKWITTILAFGYTLYLWIMKPRKRKN